MNNKILFTSESVSEGHPDKVCDQISDAILDECLKQDPNSRVACECFITTDYLLIGGEITTNAKVDYKQVAINVLKDIGYNEKRLGFDFNNCTIDVRIDEQSSDIDKGTNDEVGGAGDQGIMFGYACKETPEKMPLAIMVAHKLIERATYLRKEKIFNAARPDMKAQVTIDYSQGKPRIDTILMSIQHHPAIDMHDFGVYVKRRIMDYVVEEMGLNKDYKILINPTGRFVIGGPHGDTGLTGRKIIVDTYGGYAKHGGGAFSGKDATKVDRSAAYMARYIAKNIVASNICEKIEIQLSYAIGVKEPVSINVNTFGTGAISDENIIDIINRVFDLTPQGIIKQLHLKEPIYRDTAVLGHFGRNCFPWEKEDKVIDILKCFLK